MNRNKTERELSSLAVDVKRTSTDNDDLVFFLDNLASEVGISDFLVAVCDVVTYHQPELGAQIQAWLSENMESL